MEATSNINDIKDGDILLESGTSFLADEIQQFEDCKWNHAGWFKWLDGTLFIVEAIKSGVALTNFQDYINQIKAGELSIMVCSPKQPWTDEEMNKATNWALPLCGRARYGYINLFLFQPVKYAWKKLFGKEEWIGYTYADQVRRWICGQLVMRIYNIGKGYFEKTWISGAPVDIYNSQLFTQKIFKA